MVVREGYNPVRKKYSSKTKWEINLLSSMSERKILSFQLWVALLQMMMQVIVTLNRTQSRQSTCHGTVQLTAVAQAATEAHLGMSLYLFEVFKCSWSEIYLFHIYIRYISQKVYTHSYARICTCSAPHTRSRSMPVAAVTYALSHLHTTPFVL